MYQIYKTDLSIEAKPMLFTGILITFIQNISLYIWLMWNAHGYKLIYSITIQVIQCYSILEYNLCNFSANSTVHNSFLILVCNCLPVCKFNIRLYFDVQFICICIYFCKYKQNIFKFWTIYPNALENSSYLFWMVIMICSGF